MISSRAACVFRWRTVDLVGEQQLREDRPRSKSKLALLHVEDRRSGDVRRHQVGSELDPSELAAKDLAERSHEQSLAETGDGLDQHVSSREQRGQRSQHKFILPDKHLANLCRDGVVQLLNGCKLL